MQNKIIGSCGRLCKPVADEIESLRAEKIIAERKEKDARKLYKEVVIQKEKYRLILEEINDEINPLPFTTDYDKAMEKAKAEAVKEFAERLCDGRLLGDPVLIAVREELRNMTEPTKVEHSSLCETETYMGE